MTIRESEPMRPAETFHLERFATPTGAMHILTDDRGGLRALDWETHDARMQTLLRRRYGAAGFRVTERVEASPARRALDAYFAGDMDAFVDIEVVTNGTEFQEAVWAALRGIPPRQTRTYGQIAARIGRPAAVRAVGLANGANPVAIVVPCHRVIGADGGLTGYGGGLDRKRWLLAHEGVFI
jgi:methylated-DNA-[protein]-cysteine S-methyltransferase